MAGRGEDPAHQGLYRPLGRGRGHPRSLRRHARGPGSRRHRSAFSGYFGGILRHRQQDPAAEGGYFSPLAWLCSIQCRHHHRRTASTSASPAARRASPSGPQSCCRPCSARQMRTVRTASSTSWTRRMEAPRSRAARCRTWVWGRDSSGVMPRRR